MKNIELEMVFDANGNLANYEEVAHIFDEEEKPVIPVDVIGSVNDHLLKSFESGFRSLKGQKFIDYSAAFTSMQGRLTAETHRSYNKKHPVDERLKIIYYDLHISQGKRIAGNIEPCPKVAKAIRSLKEILHL